MEVAPTMAPILPHGGSGEDFLRAHYPGAAAPWIDLSTGINPWPYPCDAISATALHRLPSPSLFEECRAAAAQYFGADKSNVALLPGSQAAIALLPALFAPAKVAVLNQSYGEHALAWRGHAAHCVAAADVENENADILVLTNPNNPDGRVWTREAILALAQARTMRGQWLVVDEAFADIAPEISVADSCARNNLIVFRSFGKFFGLAGLRLGFAIAPAELAVRLEAAMGPWGVSGPALEAGCRAYQDQAWHRMTRPRLAQAAQQLRALLNHFDLADLGGTDLFLLAGHSKAESLFDTLCRHGLYVRRFAGDPCKLRFGLPVDGTVSARLEAGLREWAQTP